MTTTAPYELSLCTPARDLPVRSSEWWMEPKMDGIRLQIVASGGEVRCYSRAGLQYNGRLPAAEAAFAALDVVVDGEVVWFDPQTGQPDFHKGSGMFRQGCDSSVRQQRADGPLTFVAFDLLSVAGQDVRRMPIETRRQLLTQLVQGLECPQIQLIEQTEVSREAQADFVQRYREGVVLKKKGSAYVARSTHSHEAQTESSGRRRRDRHGCRTRPGQIRQHRGCVVFGQLRDGVLERRGTCSGMTDAERDEIWHFPERFVGRVLVIRHMGTDGEIPPPGEPAQGDPTMPPDAWS